MCHVRKRTGSAHLGGEEVKLGKFNLSSLSIDELWKLHEEVGAMLSERITAEKRELEKRLAKLNRGSISDKILIPGKAAVKRVILQSDARRPRRKYPPVLPKFQNPADPAETWAGRGKQPRWLVTQLKAGKKINDFLINRSKRRSA
jgi:DNA-binding protein H-NS